MSVHHFFTSPDRVGDGRLALVGPEAHHAARVLRVRPGETISVADGSGRVVDAVVVRVGDVVEARVILERMYADPRPATGLYQGVAKGERMDLVVQKAVELGVRRIVPFLAERTIVRWDEAKRAKAQARWEGVARAAAKQSRSPWLTEIAPVEPGLPGPEGLPPVLLVLHEGATAALRDALPAVPPERLGLVVGPEGGLTDDEVGALVAAGAEPVTLGQRILRTETAGPVALALVAFRYGQLG